MKKQYKQICSNPDPETAFNELAEAKDKELNTFCQVFGSRGGIASRDLTVSALMKMRWVVTFKDDGLLKARLVVQRFHGPKTWQDPNVLSRRSRQIFLTLAASLGFQTHKETSSVHFFKGDWDEQHADDHDDDAGKIESVQPVSDTFCEPVTEFVSKAAIGAIISGVRLLKVVYGLVNAPRRWYRRVATHLPNMRGEETFMEPCLWPFRDENALCLVSIDDVMLACSDSPFGNMSLLASTIFMHGELGSSVHTVRCTDHTSLRQTHSKMGRI